MKDARTRSVERASQMFLAAKLQKSFQEQYKRTDVWAEKKQAFTIAGTGAEGHDSKHIKASMSQKQHPVHTLNLLNRVRNPERKEMDPRKAYGHVPLDTVRDMNTIVKSSQSVERTLDQIEFNNSLYEDQLTI